MFSQIVRREASFHSEHVWSNDDSVRLPRIVENYIQSPLLTRVRSCKWHPCHHRRCQRRAFFWRRVAVLVIASGCVAWVIIIATDQSASHKAAVTQKVVPHKVGRGAPTDWKIQCLRFLDLPPPLDGNGFYKSGNPFEDLEKSGPVGNVFRQNFGELVIWWFGGHRAIGPVHTRALVEVIAEIYQFWLRLKFY